MTTRRPPAPTMRRAASGVITVPPPIRARSPNLLCQQCDGAERVGRVERHLDDAQARFEQGGADIVHLFRLDAAQDGDQRHLGKRFGEVHAAAHAPSACATRPASRAIAIQPSTMQSEGTISAVIPSSAAALR